MTDRGMERIELSDGAYLEYEPNWLPDADHVFAALMREVPWEARAIRIFGREVMQPRLVAWIGDPDAVYTYSGTRHDPLPWTPTLATLNQRLHAFAFNSVLCNLYRNGRDSMGMHRDAEPELGPDPIVASVSLGATRRFQLRRDDEEHELALTSGSLLIMRGTTQRYYRHGVPKEPKVDQPRINLTFRRIF